MIRNTLRSVSGISIQKYSPETTRTIEKQITARIHGQHGAIKQLMPSLSMISAAMTDPKRPAGVYLFYGPTGSGKSELAKAIAETVFDGAYHKEDMSTYTEQHSVARIVGSPPGYLGSDTTPQWLKYVDEHQRAVLLFDEIEKAHRDVMDYFVEFLDTGIFTDARGIQHDARGCLIIMTSNITFGRKSIRITPMGQTPEKAASPREEIRASGEFRTEFIGRLQEIVKFQELSEDAVHHIASDMVHEIVSRLDAIGISAAVEQEWIDDVIAHYTPSMGARSMRTFAENEIKLRIISKYKGGAA